MKSKAVAARETVLFSLVVNALKICYIGIMQAYSYKAKLMYIVYINKVGLLVFHEHTN